MAAIVGLEYNRPGYGWLLGLVPLLAALFGTVWCGLQGLRRGTLPRRVARALIAAPATDAAGGFLTFWYLPPGVVMGILLAWAIAAVTISRTRMWPLDETSAVRSIA